MKDFYDVKIEWRSEGARKTEIVRAVYGTPDTVLAAAFRRMNSKIEDDKCDVVVSKSRNL